MTSLSLETYKQTQTLCIKWICLLHVNQKKEKKIVGCFVPSTIGEDNKSSMEEDPQWFVSTVPSENPKEHLGFRLFFPTVSIGKTR